MLTLVRPAPAGQESRGPSKKRYRPRIPLLSPDERARVRAALRNLRDAYGGWDVLAAVMGVARGTVKDVAIGRDNVSPGIVIRAARAAGRTVDALLAPLGPADVCPHCGARRPS